MIAANVQARIMAVAVFRNHGELRVRDLCLNPGDLFTAFGRNLVVGDGAGSMSEGGFGSEEKTISSTTMCPSRARSTISK